MNKILVPYVDFVIQHALIKEQLLTAVSRVLGHGGFVLGAEVESFEKTFATYCGVKHAIGVASGTDALILSLKSLGIGPGDEVITAPNAFYASTSCIALAGATPVFADVGEDLNLDPDKVKAAITTRTKAIIAVHLTGRIADMDRLLSIAKRHGLYLIEDSAQAAGASYKGKRAGSFGKTACFSFHPLKTLGACGDGGIIVTDDDNLHNWLIKARNHGIGEGARCEFFSINSRLDAMQAAILAVKMDYFESWNEKRRQHAKAYRDALSAVVTVPSDHAYEFQVYHTFTIRAERRDALREHLLKNGVDTRVHYEVYIPHHKAAENIGCKPGDLPFTDRLAQETLSLPIYAEMTVDQRTLVIDSILSFYRGN